MEEIRCKKHFFLKMRINQTQSQIHQKNKQNKRKKIFFLDSNFSNKKAVASERRRAIQQWPGK